ncbi:MAG: formylglycine-generating enzyme family protein [Polyangiales bacterium]
MAREGRVRVRSGESSWASPDTKVVPKGERVVTGVFAIDRVEVTWDRFRHCVDDGACRAVHASQHGAAVVDKDPGQAVHSVTYAEARTFCQWAQGRLPTDGEWLRVALGAEETRYPWGDPDALCVRAAYGLVTGPCSTHAIGPDTAGARPMGATKEGVLDVAGNVAEWVDNEPDSPGLVRGGSFVDTDATMLRARSRQWVDPSKRYPFVGFRCAYDAMDDLTP